MKKTLLFPLILFLIIFQCSCYKSKIQETTYLPVTRITYYRDCRVGLCFAEIVQQKTVTGHCCVPCEMVEKYIEPCK